MKIYLACPTGKRRDEIVSKHGAKIGACLTRDVFNNITANKMPYFFDNGAFSDAKNNLKFDEHKFTKNLLNLEAKIRFKLLPQPDFVVVPDIVFGGKKSLKYSCLFKQYLDEKFPYFKYALAVQDGMDRFDIECAIQDYGFDMMFVGGSKQYKYQEGSSLVVDAKDMGIPIHCGGIGNRKSILWAKLTGFDSVDSGVAMIHPKHLDEVLNMEKELLWNAA